MPSDAWLVAIGAGLATFVASVMGDEQNQRLRNGAFGGIVGSSIGAVSALLNDNKSLLLVGFVASSAGAFIGWLVYLGLSAAAAFSWGRRLLEYHVNGLKGVGEQMRLDQQRVLLGALSNWRQDFSRMILRQKAQLILATPGVIEPPSVAVIQGWLESLVDIFNLVLETLAKKPKYQCRVTIIVFGSRAGKIIGRHWISYTGRLPKHRELDFDTNSIGYKVLVGRLASPYFTTGDDAKSEGQNRGQQNYRPFYTFRLNAFSILALDWPDSLAKEDPYVQVAEDLMNVDVAPALGEVLNHWSASAICKLAGIDPLPTDHSVTT